MSPTAERIPPPVRSRQLAVPVAAFGLLADGLGVFLANDVAAGVPFTTNYWVWIGLLHAAFCVGIAVFMGVGDWSWRAAHMGFASLSYLALGYLLLSSYIGLALYSSAPVWVRATMLLALIAYHGWWVLRIVMRYRCAWHTAKFRRLIYVEQEDCITFRRSGEQEVRRRLGIKFFPGNLTIVATLLVSLGSYLFRRELTEYFGAQWVPIAFAIGGFTMSVFTTTLVTMSVLLYFVYPGILKRQTGKSVFIDLLSPSPSVPSH